MWPFLLSILFVFEYSQQHSVNTLEPEEVSASVGDVIAGCVLVWLLRTGKCSCASKMNWSSNG